MGSYASYQGQPLPLLWALSGTAAEIFVALFQFLRIARPGDRTIAWAAFACAVSWLCFVLAFGHIIGTYTDFRVLIQIVVTLVPALFSVRQAIGRHA